MWSLWITLIQSILLEIVNSCFPGVFNQIQSLLLLDWCMLVSAHSVDFKSALKISALASIIDCRMSWVIDWLVDGWFLQHNARFNSLASYWRFPLADVGWSSNIEKNRSVGLNPRCVRGKVTLFELWSFEVAFITRNAALVNRPADE